MSRQQKRSFPPPSPSAKNNGKAATSHTVLPQTSVPHPAPDDRDAWRAYWTAQGQTWRTEPEIDPQRQKELDQRRGVIPDIKQGIYPFKGMKLSRADVEWLLGTHENGQGPVDWSNDDQRKRKGLDVRGANLSHVVSRYVLCTHEQAEAKWPGTRLLFLLHPLRGPLQLCPLHMPRPLRSLEKTN